MGACRPIPWSPACARRAACSPRTRRGCCATAAGSPAELDELVARRVDGAPLEPLLGWAEFCGLRIAVDPGVFVPRQRTAFLVAQAVRLAGPGAVVVDLCCGTGAIGAALAAAVPGVEVHAADVDPAAVACARRNLPAAGVYQGDLYAALPDTLRGRVDLLVANAPYVPDRRDRTDAARGPRPRAPRRARRRRRRPRRPAPGRRRRPRLARPGGALLIETGADQAPHTAAVFAAAGLVPHVEYAEDATVVIGVA